jgi:glycosyltransferase involved in cell wall biosynthesis
VCLPNGVDLDRFQPSDDEPDPARVLFIGSFAHLPNVLALDFFLREAWPLLLARRPDARFHIIAGRDPLYFLERCQDRVRPNIASPGVEMEDFVPDPRPAYRRATAVVAPLLASAGTNIKVLEAMAMGRAVVATRGGVNGLDDLADGRDVVIADTGEAIAAALAALFSNPAYRTAIERHARRTVEERYGWKAIGRRQGELYESLRRG